MDCTGTERIISDAIPSLQDVSIRLFTEREPHLYMLAEDDDSDTSSGASSGGDEQEDVATFVAKEEDAGW